MDGSRDSALEATEPVTSGDAPSRTDTLLEGVSKDARIIEIGPSFNPVAPRSRGWNSFSLDHMTREGLAEKYADHPGVDVRMIEPVDFVWSGGALSDAVPPGQHGSFDVFLASHVIEHTPDLIAFLDAAATLLKPDGAVVLAVPDKRSCFDFFQPTTTTGQVLEAHATGRVRHHRERAFDHFAYAVADGDLEAWGGRPSQGLRLIHTLESAAGNARIFQESKGYHDLHAWHFVPSSFELLMLELGWLGETDWRVDRMVSPPGAWEFFAWLRRGASARTGATPEEELRAQRLALLTRSLLETQAQIEWLAESKPDLSAGLSAWTPPALRIADAKRLAAQEAETAELRRRLAESEAHHAAAERRAAALEASTFWRATAPVRKLLGRVRRPGMAEAGGAR